MGINAVRGPVGVHAGVGGTEMACWMTAGVGGCEMVSLSSVAGVMRSWVLSLMIYVVSRLAMRSITASFTMESGRGLRVMPPRRAYHLGTVLVTDVESDVVLDVELPCAFVVLEREA